MDGADLRSSTQDAFWRPVEGGAVVFHRASRRLFSLNGVAAFIWAALQAGEADEDIVASLCHDLSVQEPQARAWLEDSLSMFERVSSVEHDAGTLEGGPATAAAPDRTRSGNDYRLLGRTVRIAAPAQAMETIDGLLGNLKVPAGDEGVFDSLIEIVEAGGGYDISGPRFRKEGVGAGALVGEVEQAVIQAVVPEIPQLLAFHSALLSREGQGILLSAPSGSGKTTLSVLLASRGWRFCSDEMALLGRDLRWRGVSLPPCVKAGSFEAVGGWWPRLDDAQGHERFGRHVKFLKLPHSTAPAPVRTVVFPRFGADSPTSLDRVEPLDGLTRLLAECVFIPPEFGSAEVEALLGWHEGVRYWELAFGNPQEAAETIERLRQGLAG